jgi:hypothetical protein
MNRIAFDLLVVAKELIGLNMKEARQWIGIVRDGTAKVKTARPGQSHAQLFGNFETMLADNRFIFTKHDHTLNWYAPPTSVDKAAAEIGLADSGFHSGFHHEILEDALAM